MKGLDKDTWFRWLANEFGRLAQGVGKIIKWTNAITFIPKKEVPFATKKLHMDGLFVISNLIKQKHMEVDWWCAAIS